MQTQLQAAINQICAEKNLDSSIVVEAIENAISVAYKKDFGNPQQSLKVHLGDDISQLRIFEERIVVQKVEDYDAHISLKEAKVIRPDAGIDDTVYIPVVIDKEFGRIAAQTAKHIISQKLQEAEKAMLFEKFKDREGELLTARVQKVDKDSVLLDIEGVSTLLYNRQQIRGEKYFTGQRVKVLLRKVETSFSGPQLDITRANEDFIIALFEREIPEMKDNTVYVARIARESGVRCKIAVESDDKNIDPVGAFVGQRGVRINSVMEEIGIERLDVIQYHENKKKLLIAALAPAKISKLEFVEENGEMRAKIYVPDDQRAIVIGKKGQNIRLAGKLVECQVDVVTYDGEPDPEFAEKEVQVDEKKKKRVVSKSASIDDLNGVSPDVIAKLKAYGLVEIKFFEDMKVDELAEMEDISEAEAKSVIDAVHRYIND